jgi:hypothetical protein
MCALAERLREKAREYELNKLAAEERHDPAAPVWATVAVTLYEVAQAVEDDE